MDTQGAVRFRFGDFVIDLESGQLFKNGRQVSMQAKPFALLAELVRRRGQVATRSELASKLWPETFVQVNQGLNAAIRKIRQTLGDSAQSPKYLETLGSRGYRFVHPVEVVRTSGPLSRVADKTRIALIPIAEEQERTPSEELMSKLGDRLAALDPEINIVSPAQSAPNRDSLASLGRQLEAQFLIAGTVHQNAAAAQVEITMLATPEQTRIWSEVYTRAVHELPGIEEEIASGILSAIRKQPSQAAPKYLTSSFYVYENYLRARYFWNKRTATSVRQSLKYFEQALEADPNYAPAHAGMADCYNVMAAYNVMLSREAYNLAQQSARRASELEPNLPEAMAPLGWSNLALNHDWSRSRDLLRRAIELNPSFAYAYCLLSFYELSCGRCDSALTLMEHARRLDPLSLPVNSLLALFQFYGDDFEGAIRQAQRTLELDPSYEGALFPLGLSLTQMDRHDEALRTFKKLVDVSSGSLLSQTGLAYGLASAGDKGEAVSMVNAILQEQQDGAPVPSFHIAVIYAALGEDETAVEWLRRAVQERSQWTLFLTSDPAIRRLTNHPALSEWTELLKKASQETSPILALPHQHRP